MAAGPREGTSRRIQRCAEQVGDGPLQPRSRGRRLPAAVPGADVDRQARGRRPCRLQRPSVGPDPPTDGGDADMTTVAAYDPSEPIGDGRTIIEASAGTGKTFTIAAAVTRLVAVEGLGLEEILVVTFTRAATAELKGRVRTRMVDTLRALDGHDTPGGIDEHMRVLLDVHPATRGTYRSRLAGALTHFDRAQIFTIDGFARRLLGALGFRVRSSADMEVGAVDDQLLVQVANDLMVQRFADNPNGDAVPKASDAVVVGKVVVDTPDARVVPEVDEVSGMARTRVEIALAIAAETARRMRAARVTTFDGELIEVRDALADPEIGHGARTLLQRRYAAALVDESQDTDPIQWQVIRAIFDESRLVVIGDPKQSIYSFRGADVESYLSSIEGATARRTLGTNWRSDGPLIAALDTLLDGVTFGDERIAYRNVRPAPGQEGSRIHGTGPPLSIRRFDGDLPIDRRRDGYFKVGSARQAVAADVANEIVALLSCGVTIDSQEGNRPVGPADIAVLCRTRKQVDLIRAELTKRAVPSVAARTGGVFTTIAAEEWRRLLLAIERPDRIDYVRLAATTLLIGYSPAQVAVLDESAVLDLQYRMRSWQVLLYDEGVPALIADVGRTTGLAGRVLALADGERIMTDLTHIAEEMHAVWRLGRIGSLAGWLETTISEAAAREDSRVEEPESRQRRLQTDAEAVQVRTIHGAKGLEFPVVFVPYAWDVPSIKPVVPVFHDPDAEVGGTPRRRLVDVGGREWSGFAEHVDLAMAEDGAEEGRLLYVALTRAKHRLVVWWIENAKSTASSKLAEVITTDDRSPEDLVAQSRGTIEMPMVEALPSLQVYAPPPREHAVLGRARFERSLDHDWRRASFTSLSPEHLLAGAVETSEHPLRVDEPNGADDAPPPTVGIELPMAGLPRGARFGTLVHEIFERLAFDARDMTGAVTELLEAEMRRSAWDFDPDAFVAGMVAAMETPLGPDAASPRLRDLDPSQMLHEMTFELPVHTQAGTVSLGDIGFVMADHLSVDDPFRRYADQLLGLGAQRFRGYLTGAIDLVATLPGPGGSRYVVMDYKSNALAALGETAGPLDYGPDPLAGAMIESNYVLQATLYQVALHRYLQWRLAGYDPANHLGGSMYLFVRGMAGADTPVVDGERCGVARWQPPAEMITALSELFTGSRP
ncbi:MAG TPA: AAA family ATPase [Actinobacteria bacterium]|nr:AAA family ATPase [Actinomycetota bacterium]